MIRLIKIINQKIANKKIRDKQAYIERRVSAFMNAQLLNAQKYGYTSLRYHQWLCVGLHMIGAMDCAAEDVGAVREEYAFSSTKRLLIEILNCDEETAENFASRLLSMSTEGLPYTLTEHGKGSMREFLSALQKLEDTRSKEAKSLINESNNLTEIIKMDIHPDLKTQLFDP